MLAVQNTNNKSKLFWLDIDKRTCCIATFMHISMLPQCFSSLCCAKTFFPSDSLALLDKGISFLAGAPPPPVSPRLCNSCSVERVMSAAFLFQSVFLEQMAKGELGSGPRARWGMCQFLQECVLWARLACLPPALCPEWRQQDFPSSAANIWCLALTGRDGGSAWAHSLLASHVCSCSGTANNLTTDDLNAPIRGKTSHERQESRTT